jgi:TPR repeat protein
MRKALAWLLPLLLAALPSPAAAGEPGLRAKLEALATAGHGEAAYHLGMLHHLGLEGTAKDPRKAFDLFRLSAERGDPLGAYKLGCFYAGQGDGAVEPDEALALRYKLIAAQAGYELAQEDVAGLYFRRGETDTALRWLEAAAAQGGFGSLMMLGGLYSGLLPALGVEPDPVRYYAYTMLSLREAGDEFADMKREMEAELRSKLSPEQLAAGRAIVAAWRPSPTPLTLKARAGLQAAEGLAAATP